MAAAGESEFASCCNFTFSGGRIEDEDNVTSSFGTLVGGAYLMTSYLDKHFESVRILCAADFCLQNRPVNPIVYIVQKK